MLWMQPGNIEADARSPYAAANGLVRPLVPARGGWPWLQHIRAASEAGGLTIRLYYHIFLLCSCYSFWENDSSFMKNLA